MDMMAMLKKWMWFVIGFLVVSCCVLIGAIGGASQSPEARQAVAEVVATVAPLPTKPAPTVDTFAMCKSEVSTWLSNLLLVTKKLSSSMGDINAGDLLSAYEAFKDAKLMFGAITSPTCDADAMSLHNRMREVLNLTDDAYKAMAAGDFETSTEKLRESNDLVNQMTGTMEAINRKYGW